MLQSWAERTGNYFQKLINNCPKTNDALIKLLQSQLLPAKAFIPFESKYGTDACC